MIEKMLQEFDRKNELTRQLFTSGILTKEAAENLLQVEAARFRLLLYGLVVYNAITPAEYSHALELLQ